MKKERKIIFDVIIKYLGFLKSVPLFPQIFDAFLQMNSLLFNKKTATCMREVERTVSKWKDIHMTFHKYGGLQFNYKRKELGHMHGNGLVDILLDRKTKAELMAKGIVSEHHTFKKSGWISIYMKDERNAQTAITVLKISLLRYKKPNDDLLYVEEVTNEKLY